MLLFPFLTVVTAIGVSGATFNVVNTNDSGSGSFRQALLNANTNQNSDIIAFKIPGNGPFTIKPTLALPSITAPVTIDGTTQTNYAGKPKVELNGSVTPAGTHGLYILTSNCVVRGLAINRFKRDGIRIENYGGHVIAGNFIGTGVYGTNSAGNAEGGITVFTAGNVIGGTDPTNRNIISGSNLAGIYLLNAAATGNLVQGNYIGTDVTGTKRLGNITNGIVIANAQSNTIGGTVAGARNIISGNYQSGVYLTTAANGNLVAGNYIGTDFTGAVALSNAADGVTIFSSARNLIGGTNSAARNIISGNGQRGVYLFGGGTTGNSIQGNYIGTAASGLAKLRNTYSGVDFDNVSSNTVGGTVPGALNVISGNGLSGVAISDPNAMGNATANVVLGNYIGTDATGTNALGNDSDGVFIFAGAYNVVGGTNVAARNVISGNLEDGVFVTNATARSNQVLGNFIGTDVTGKRRLGNAFAGVRLEAPANLIGGPDAGARNLISGNTDSGVYLFGVTASNNVIQGNFIGTDTNGTAGVSNGFSGVQIEDAPANLVGGSDGGARNIISGNADRGVYLIGVTASNNLIQGNFIGTDVNGTAGVSNGKSGVLIESAPANLVGGLAGGARNLISGNRTSGIYLYGVAASNNVIQGNFIGTDVNGTAGVPNGVSGVEIESAPANSIGGSTAGAGNVISGNVDAGIYLTNAAGTQIQGNRIGTDVSGASAVANQFGGIYLYGSSSSLIGGPAPGAGNQISGNYQVGIYLSDAGTTGNVIQGNLLGTKADGVGALPNFLHNIDIQNASSSNLIGGTAPGAGNVIAFTAGAGYDGVRIRGGCLKNLIRGNSFFSNGTGPNSLGIDLGADGPTANDGCDGNSGTNYLQNYPLLLSAKGGSQTTIQGSLNSTANRTFLLQFYANATCDASTYGEGLTFLGDAMVTTDGSCNTNFTVVLTNVVPAGSVLTATATDSTNNTSEFSPCVSLVIPPTIVSQPASRTNIAGTTASFTVEAAGTLPLIYQWKKSGTNLVNGGNVSGATTNALTLVNVGSGDATNYTVVITNSADSVTSAVATLTVIAPPVLSISYAGGQLTLAWPAAAAAFGLQQTGSLSPPISWTSATNYVPALVGGQYMVSITPGSGTRFYRLFWQ